MIRNALILACTLMMVGCAFFEGTDHSQQAGHILIDGFPPVKVDKDLDVLMVTPSVERLVPIYDLLIPEFEQIYGFEANGYVNIISIFPTGPKPAEGYCPSGNISLAWEFENQWSHDFAHELHNLYRCVAFGPQNVYCSANEIPSPEQCAAAHELIDSIP